tara:strand:- start:2725 stop:4695 length:1971 start_codon:yes stop_codon:yes gene_type:complete
MRIYTEVNFQWDDKKGKLVEVSSDSFDYSGEMALCKRKWKTWGDRMYDDAGNIYRLRVNWRDWGDNQVREAKIQKSSDGGSTWDKDWKHTKDAMRATDARDWLERRVAAKSTVSGEAHGTRGSDDGGAAWKTWFGGEYHGYDPSSTDITANIAFMDSVADASITWSEETKTWTGLSEEGEIIDIEDVIDVEQDLTEDQAVIKSETDVELRRLAKEWGEIVDIEQYDMFQSEIEEYVEGLGESEEDMFTAFTDMDEAIGEAKSEYQKSIERLTGEEGTYTRDVEALEEDKAQNLRDLRETRTEELRDLGLEKTEGLEETVLTREEELEALREEGVGGIRAAEAKMGIAGFASTGVGQTARDILAEEIGKGARDIDVGFTEERGDITTGYEIATGDIATGYATEFQDIAAGHETALETLRIGKEEALEDYKEIRDKAVSDKPWETATKTYERLLKDLPDVIETSTAAAEARLGVLGEEMETAIRLAREGLTTKGGEGVGAISTYDPFAYGGALSGEEYSFLQPAFAESGILGMKFDEAFVEGLFGADQYGAYTPGEDYMPYQPEFLAGLGFGVEEEEEEEEEYDPFAVIKKSDINIKKDITRVSKLKNGIPVYLFRYKWSDKMSIGVMAQDVEKILPEAVIKVDGIKAVNYNILNKKV